MNEVGHTQAAHPVNVEVAEAKQVARLRLANLLRWIRNSRPGSDSNLFADPGWDLLLEIYSRHLIDDDRTAISDLSVALGLPRTTTARWIAILEKHNWVQRLYGPEGGATLTAFAHDALSAYADRLLEGVAEFSGEASDHCALIL